MVLLPELSILCFSVIFLFMSMESKKGHPAGVARLLAVVVLGLTIAAVFQRGDIFAGAYRVDMFSQFFKIIIAAGFFLVIFMIEKKEEISENWLPEFIMLLGLSTLGLEMLVSANELITMVLALEISSYSLYAAVPLRRGQSPMSLEAGMKYIFFGALATGIMLYGMGYIYGLVKSTGIPEITAAMPQHLGSPMGILALTLTLAAFLFKLSVFPMHFWAPDVYEGSSNVTTTFISTVPKMAALAILIRLTMTVSADSLPFMLVIMILAGVSMTMGNLVGLVQKDMKRLLAWSGIAHAGYILLGILALSRDGYSAAMYYITMYLFANMAAFYVLVLISRQGDNVGIEELSGLIKRAPLLAVTLAVAAFSLAGVPPTGGFTGKLFLFTGALKDGHLAIVIIAAVNTAISIFYYLNLVRISFTREPEPSSEAFSLSMVQKLICCLFIAAILYLGVYPYALLEFLRSAI